MVGYYFVQAFEENTTDPALPPTPEYELSFIDLLIAYPALESFKHSASKIPRDCTILRTTIIYFYLALRLVLSAALSYAVRNFAIYLLSFIVEKESYICVALSLVFWFLFYLVPYSVLTAELN